jgi:osmotically-inducible protein OsmY
MIHGSEKIKKDIFDRLNWDIRVRASDIDIELDNGIVRLTGTVPNFTARLAAQLDAYVVPGVKKVKNELKIRYPKGAPSDKDIKSRIEDILLWNSDINASKISISVSSGVVLLTGSVKTYLEKIKAEEIASNINGVTNVKNKITVVPSESYKDKVIAENIIAALDKNVYINTNAIKVYVKVENGKVKLSGAVPDFATHRAVLDVVFYTPGVSDVIDNLFVG